MNNILEELNKLTNKELNNILENNKYLKNGSLVIFKNEIYKVLLRSRDDIIINKDKELTTIDVNSVKLLNKNNLDDLNKLRYIKVPFINTREKIVKYFNSVLERAFNKDNFEVKTLYDDYIKVTVFYPEIDVTNSLGIKHKLLDVYLTLIFRKLTHYIKLHDYIIFRGKYTKTEVKNNYTFSHVKPGTGRTKHNSEWCLGNTSFKSYVENCEGLMYSTELLFLISQFRSYLGWESLEGVPFKKISDLKPFEVKPVSKYDLEYDLDTIIDKIKKRLENFTYIFTTEYGLYKVFLTNETIEKIKKIFKSIYPNLCFYFIDENSVDIIDYDENKIRVRFDNPDTLIFKDKEITPEIVENNDGKEVIENIKKQFNLEPHKALLDDIIVKLEEEFLEYLIKEKFKQL